MTKQKDKVVTNNYQLSNEKMKNYRILSFFLLLSLTAGMQAKVRLPHILGDNMILQQNADAHLWGWDKPGKIVKITSSWSSKMYKVKTDADGKWQTSIKTPAASYKPLQITFDDGEALTLKNILSGEVWVCAGQSNMEMPIRGFSACPVEGYNETVADAVNSKGIHFVKIPSVMSMRPLEDANCEWTTVTPETVGDCSATGYFFAWKMNRTLNIPIGLILANKGGTRIECWLDKDYLTKNTNEPTDSASIVKGNKREWRRQMVWGNGTFNPILKYSVKGILFYQGCSNVGNPIGQYTQRLKGLVSQWRRGFNQGELPFYYVQIAPYASGDPDGDWNTKLRFDQQAATKIIPNSDLVCIQDLLYPYEKNQVHPSQKRQVGERLAYLALNKQYGMTKLKCESPSFESMRISNDTCFVKLTNLYEGVSRLEDLEGFEVAGADKVFHKVTATYDYNKGIIITTKEVENPVAVRYCWRNYQAGNVANAGGLPLFPFRTDDW